MDAASKVNFNFQKIIAAVGVILLSVKFAAYFMTGSVAILTDALESIVNVIAAFVGLYALYISAMPPDKDHPFGHGKIENISAAIEGSMITIAGLIIVYESIYSFFHPGEIRQLDFGLVIIAAAALVNYIVGRAAIAKGKKNRSPALVASGKHLCSDTLSSVGIIIGLLVVYVLLAFGYDAAWLDSSIAIVFGIIIGYTGIKVLKQSMDDSMDKTDEVLLEDITKLLNEYRHDDWIDLYRLRMIKYGHKIYVDLHLVLSMDMTVEHAEHENDELAEALKSRFGDSVEISMTPVSCHGKMCRYCQRNCLGRSHEFEKYLTWTGNMLCSQEMHLPTKVIEIDEAYKENR